jgi:hypothetical protein
MTYEFISTALAGTVVATGSGETQPGTPIPWTLSPSIVSNPQPTVVGNTWTVTLSDNPTACPGGFFLHGLGAEESCHISFLMVSLFWVLPCMVHHTAGCSE